MSRRQWALVALIAAEVVAGAVFLLRSRTRAVPPVVDLSFVDPFVAEHLRARSAACTMPDDWAALGEEYLAYGYFHEAEACYRVAAEREWDRSERAYQWAFALERVGKLEQANAEYERALSLGYSHPDDCRYFIGRNFLRLEQADPARGAFEAAGNHPSARYERARLLVRDGRASDAVPILDSLYAAHPQAIQPYLLRHRIDALQSWPGAARFADLANRARGRLPTPFDKEWNRLEETYNRLGLTGEITAIEKQLASRDVAGAERKLRAVLATGWNPAATDLLAEVEAQRGRPAEAVRLLQEAVEREGPSSYLLERLGDAHERNGQLPQAVQTWTRATELGSGAGVKNLHLRLEEHYRKAGNDRDARWRSARAHLAAGHELFWAGNARNARGAFEKATELEPTLAAAWFYLGESNRVLGRAEQAAQAYARCLALDPDHGRAIAGQQLLTRP